MLYVNTSYELCSHTSGRGLSPCETTAGDILEDSLRLIGRIDGSNVMDIKNEKTLKDNEIWVRMRLWVLRTDGVINVL